jgi:F-type H+/Na+-transporting ATPase subunit alpha
MKQPQYAPMSVAQMALSLFAVNQGYLDDVDVAKVQAFEAALQSYMRSNYASVMEKINRTPDYNDEIESQLKSAIEKFKTQHTW